MYYTPIQKSLKSKEPHHTLKECINSYCHGEAFILHNHLILKIFYYYISRIELIICYVCYSSTQ